MSLSPSQIRELLSISDCKNIIDLKNAIDKYSKSLYIMDDFHKFPYEIFTNSKFCSGDPFPNSKLCPSFGNPFPIGIRNLDTNILSNIEFSFPLGFHMLEKNPDIINWSILSLNPSLDAFNLLEKNPDKIVWHTLCENPSLWVIDILEKNPDKIFWGFLCKNPSFWAISLLELNPEKINWVNLSSNTNPKAISLIEKKIEEENNLPIEVEYFVNIKKICWRNLSENPSAIDLLKANSNKINVNSLCKNPNIKALNLLGEIVERNGYNLINWYLLYKNPNALYFIQKNFNTNYIL